MGYPLHGNEFNPEIDAITGGAGWAVSRTKPSYDGREALARIREEGAPRRLRGIRALGRGIPRSGMAVLDADGQQIGVVTSGTFSPSLRVGIGLALIDAGVTGTVDVAVRSRVESFELVKLPFVPSHVRDQAQG